MPAELYLFIPFQKLKVMEKGVKVLQKTEHQFNPNSLDCKNIAGQVQKLTLLNFRLSTKYNNPVGINKQSKSMQKPKKWQIWIWQ